MNTDTIKQMWDTRPPRIPKEQGGKAYVAGVCEGIGVRYQIDPTLVRVLFVVTTLAVGGGIAAYLLAWMCMPRYGMSTSPAQAALRNTSSLTPSEKKETTLGWTLITFFALFSGFFIFQVDENWLSSTAIVAIALLLASWYGLHRHLPTPPKGLIAFPGTDSNNGAAGNADDDQPLSTSTAPAAPQVNLTGFTPADPAHHQPQPPAWDPLGTAPFAWDLPEPPPERTERPQKKSSLWKWVLTGFGVAALVLVLLGAAAGGIGYAAGFFGDPGPRAYHYAREVDEVPADLHTDEEQTHLHLAHLQPPDADTAVTLTSTTHPLEVTLPTDVRTVVHCETGPTSNCEESTLNADAPGATLTLTLVEQPGGQVLVDHPDLPYYAPGVEFQRPTSEQELQPDYRHGVGRYTLDFSRLPALKEQRDVTVSHGVGPVTILAPEGPWEITCRAGLGEDNCPAGVHNPDGDGEPLRIEVNNGIGPVTVVTE